MTMEQNSDDSASDKDKKMKDSFESFSDTDKKKDKSDKKPLPLPKIFSIEKSKEGDPEAAEDKKFSLFEMLNKDQVDEGEQAEEPASVELEPDTVEQTESVENVPTETLSESEKTQVTQAYVDVALPEVQEELAQAEPDSVEAAEAEASLAFMEGLQQLIQEDPEVSEEGIDEVAEKVKADIAPEFPDVEEESTDELPDGTAVEVDTGDDTSTPEDDHEDDEVTVSTPPTPPPTTTAHAVHASGGGVPPIGSMDAHAASMDTMTTSFDITPDNPDANFYYGRRHAGDLLLGGIVGYMIGRRRGRINTEKKLLPIQEKLEKQVDDLHKTIAAKELSIRKIATAKFEQTHRNVVPKAEKLEKQEDEVKQVETTKEAKKAKHEEQESRSPADNEQQPELSQHPDHEKNPTKAERELNPERQIPKQTIETMSLPLLLQIASEIKLDEISLSSMYEKGVISQEQLRRIVKQYMNGEKLHKIWPEGLATNQHGIEQNTELGHEKQQDSGAASTSSDGSSNFQQTVADNPATNFANPGYFNHPDVSQSPVIRSILDDVEQSPKNPRLVQPVVLLILAVIAAVIIITLFT